MENISHVIVGTFTNIFQWSTYTMTKGSGSCMITDDWVKWVNG